MKKIAMIAVLSMLSIHGLADVVEKGSATDKAVAMAISKTSVALEEVVGYTTTMLKEAKGVVVEQAPLVVKEFLVWRTWQCIFWLGIWWTFGTLALIASWRLVKTAEKEEKISSNRHSESETRMFAGLLRWFIAPLLFIVFGGPNIYEIIYIQVAPRVYLIENLVHLLKYGRIIP